MGAPGTTADGVDGTTLLLRGQLGSQVALSPGSAAQVCPILTAEVGFGPEDVDGLGTAYRSRAFGFGRDRVGGGKRHIYNFHGPINDHFAWNAEGTSSPAADSVEAEYRDHRRAP